MGDKDQSLNTDVDAMGNNDQSPNTDVDAMGNNDQSPNTDVDAMGNNDQSPNKDVDAMIEFTPSSVEYGACEKVNDDSEIPVPQDKRFGERFHTDFDFIKEIASGSYGRVIKAFSKIDKGHYAIKIIQLPKSKDVEKKVLGEVEIMAHLKDDYIVGYNTAWIDPSCFGEKLHLFIQMELCKKTLKKWLEKNMDPRDCTNVLDYFRQIVSAVDVIHSKNFIHRDLKPSNIFISKNGVLKVGDFGLVTIHSVFNELEQDAAPGTSSIHSRHKGTPLYMSPEQLEFKDYDCKADIFSLGLIYLELCIPMLDEEKGNIFKRAREGRFPREERFPDFRCQDLLRDMLVNNPAKRSTAKDILNHPVLKQTKKTIPVHGIQTINHYNIQATNVMTAPGSVMYVGGPITQTKKIKISRKKPLTKSQEQPSTDQFLDIKEKVGQDWKELGRRLKFDDSELEQMETENKTLEELIYQILRRWKQRVNVNATRERLAQVFLKLDRGDLADMLADD